MEVLSLFSTVFILLLSKSTDGQTLYPTAEGGIGAVYTMSMGSIMNEVIIHRMNGSGQLTMVSSISGNGTGVNTTSIDPLVSQGPMVIYSNCLFMVNAGSNSLSMFMINLGDATQLTLVSVKSTFGWFPVSVTVNDMYACVLTGGNITGIRCFTYNSSGLYMVNAFDRNLTSYLSQSVPPKGPPKTFSQILFSPDNLSLIIAVKGMDTADPGYLLFYLFNTDRTILSENATRMVPTNAILPFSLTPVGENGMLITDPGSVGVLTLTYSSSTGMISNSRFTPLNDSIAGGICWSTYSPLTDNYYVIATGTANVIELTVNLNSNSTPVEIVQSYQLPSNTGGLETIVVSLPDKDYLYVLGVTGHVITGYTLNGPGDATLANVALSQTGNTANIPKLAGLAAFIQTQSSSLPTGGPVVTTSGSEATTRRPTVSTGGAEATTRGPVAPSRATSYFTSTMIAFLCMIFLFFTAE